MSELEFQAASRDHLKALLEHPSAPRFNFESSDLLDRRSLNETRLFARETLAQPFWQEGQLPMWMPEFLQRQFSTVPFYRGLGGLPGTFEAVPTVDRRTLAEGVERFVPDDLDTRDLTVYTTSGTSGSSLVVPSDAAVTSKVLVLLDRLLSGLGLALPRGPGRVAVAAVFCSEETLTYPSLSHYLEGAATLKINLHASQWNQSGDAAAFLQDCAPAVITGCPHSLSRLADTAPQLRPLAVFSSAEALLDGMGRQLEQTFDCPVFDVYGMTEAKFIAAGRVGGEQLLLSPDLYVEIVDPQGRPVASGERGEITISGGRNRFLPLLRYRTGDFARLVYRGSRPCLADFQGRAPVVLADGEGRSISGLDLINTLRPLPLVGFSFEQSADLSYRLSYCGEVESETVSDLLRRHLRLNGEVSKTTSWIGKQHLFRNSVPGES